MVAEGVHNSVSALSVKYPKRYLTDLQNKSITGMVSNSSSGWAGSISYWYFESPCITALSDCSHWGRCLGFGQFAKLTMHRFDSVGVGGVDDFADVGAVFDPYVLHVSTATR